VIKVEINNIQATALPLPAPQGEPEAGSLRRYQVVAERIRQFVAQQDLAPGGRLPSERDLAGTLAVSRGSVREALLALELEGVVEVRQGSGIYLRTVQRPDAAAPAVTGTSLFELLSARRVIEPELAAVAARVATAAHVARLLALTAELTRLHAARAPSAAVDREFHLEIARAAGNNALIGVFDFLWNQCGGVWDQLDRMVGEDGPRGADVADHQHIARAIAVRNPAGARQAMRAHLDRVIEVLIRTGQPLPQR
jgi:DNA-binding FadR family transcriptional regulator